MQIPDVTSWLLRSLEEKKVLVFISRVLVYMAANKRNNSVAGREN